MKGLNQTYVHKRKPTINILLDNTHIAQLLLNREHKLCGKLLPKRKGKHRTKTKSEEFGLSAEPTCSTLVTFVHSLSVLCPFSFCVRYFSRISPTAPITPLPLTAVNCILGHVFATHSPRLRPYFPPCMLLFGGGRLLIHIQILRIRPVKLKAKTELHTQRNYIVF